MKDRRLARHQALHILYQRELVGKSTASIVADGSWDVFPLEEQDELDTVFGGPTEFCRRLLAGVEEHLEEIDESIEEMSENWTLARMPIVDRNILRLAIYEITHEPEIPHSVTINEAVEMAKLYGGEDSSKFVNGILGRLAAEVETTGRSEGDA